jgi:UDP-glucose 4-epimerase
MKNVLVTGGEGHNGLIQVLLDSCCNVNACDALYSGGDTLPNGRPKLKFVEGDVGDKDELASCYAGTDTVLLERDILASNEISPNSP